MAVDVDHFMVANSSYLPTPPTDNLLAGFGGPTKNASESIDSSTARAKIRCHFIFSGFGFASEIHEMQQVRALYEIVPV